MAEGGPNLPDQRGAARAAADVHELRMVFSRHFANRNRAGPEVREARAGFHGESRHRRADQSISRNGSASSAQPANAASRDEFTVRGRTLCYECLDDDMRYILDPVG